ncbi:transglycosylase SLT domain-containing protein [Weissella confusa]|uniref:transglycosylase SLT domain-containing protein n=1 Tax=Weissella confusa TaxID=1583 RepID=UPI003456325D
MWNGLKDFTRNGINDVIGVINGGIGGINTVIHTFGGKKNAIGTIPKFANGTKGAPKGLAIVNDAPGEHYQEAIIDNSGRATVLEGRNRLVEFSGGETVIPAHALPKFANGTDNWLDAAVGWIKDKWDKLTEFISHPIKALGNIMNKAVSGITGSSLVTNIAPAMANGLVQGIADPIVNMFKSLKKKHDDEGSASPAGSGVQRWKDLVIKALDKNGLSTSESMVNKVLRQIQTESGGNEKAVQGGYTDINTITGDLAKGLMQTISATFNAYAFPGHKNIFNGYDNLLAALAYAKNRYGSNLAGLGEGHGYAQGGIVSQHGFYEVAEQNMPEIIIPLDPAKKIRANELLAQANQRINGTQAQQVVVQSDTSQLEHKFDNVITLLSLMLGVNQDQLKAMQSQGGINLPNLMNQMGMTQSTHNYQSI